MFSVEFIAFFVKYMSEHQNTINSDIPEKILKVLRGIAKGNGIDPSDIIYDRFEGETILGRAQTQITLSPLTAQKLLTGRDQNGVVVGSEQELQTEITKVTESISTNESIAQKIKNLVIEKEGKGFAVKNYKQKLSDLHKVFVIHKACHTCQSRGKIPCVQCKSMGKFDCNVCHGFGKIEQLNNTTVSCHVCHGKKRIVCPSCKGHKKTNCHGCAASGWMSEITSVDQEATIMFHVNRSNISDDLAIMIEQQGGQMLARHDIEAENIELNEEEKQQLKPNQTAIGYGFRFPYGPIHFKFKNNSLTAILLGYQGRLAECPPFLEQCIKPSLITLKKAATAQPSKTYALLEKACQHRMIKNIIQCSAEQSPKGALKVLKRKYPYGIQNKTLKMMIGASRQSFLDLTKTGRTKGVVVGLFGALCITVLYYLVVRNGVLSHVTPTTKMVTMIDSTALVSGLVCNIYLVQLMAKMELSKRLSDLLKKPINVKATQMKIGYSWIVSVLGNLVLFFGVSFLAFTQDMITMLPAWL